jgi:co-chaperonin GroES (HSP10)
MKLDDFDAVCDYVAETFTPILWRILVVPRQIASRTQGGLELTKETNEAEFYNTKLGRVVHVPPLAYTSDTKAHTNLSNEPNKPKVGDWVIFMPTAPGRIELVGPTGNESIYAFFLSDTDIWSIISHPDRIDLNMAKPGLWAILLVP